MQYTGCRPARPPSVGWSEAAAAAAAAAADAMTEVSDFNPQMLTLARNTRQLTKTQLAKLAGVSLPAVSRYEAGNLAITAERLSEIAEFLDYPPRFFCRKPRLIGSWGGSVFHRKQQKLPVKKLYEAHGLAETRRLEISSMLNSLDVHVKSPVEYDVTLFDDDPEKIARSVRAAMNIPPGPIFNLTETLELNGYVIVAHEFGSSQMDGFSQRPDYPPFFIHLNSALPPDRWRWTLAHELGHLVMHFEPMESPKLVEEQANRFTAELLMPAHAIGHMLDGLTYHKLGGLKREWRVSMQALITRAHQLKIISPRQRRSMLARLSGAGFRTREPAALDPPVEKPSTMKTLAQRHLNELAYSRSELREFLALGEVEFKKHYGGSDDILDSLGIDDILRSF